MTTPQLRLIWQPRVLSQLSVFDDDADIWLHSGNLTGAEKKAKKKAKKAAQKAQEDVKKGVSPYSTHLASQPMNFSKVVLIILDDPHVAFLQTTTRAWKSPLQKMKIQKA